MNPNAQDLFAILDLRGLVLHSYHSGKDPEAINPLVKSQEHTLHNFTERYLKPILELVPLNHIIAVNDAGSKFRKALDETYKANREARDQDPEVKQAQEYSRLAVRELLHSLGILQCHVPGTEADDVIAHLAQRLPGHKLIYSVDGDLTALANDHTTVFLKGEPAAVYKVKYDASVNGVKEKRTIEVLPRHVTLFKSIVGDTSDNIAGVKGMGPAVWEIMVKDFGLDGLDELNAILEDEDFGKLQLLADSQRHKVLVKLADNMSQWRNSFKLARLRPELVDGKQGKEFTRIKWDKRLPSRNRMIKLEQVANAPWLRIEYGKYLPTQTLITAPDWDDTVLPDFTDLLRESRFIAIDWEAAAEDYENLKEAGGDKYVDMLSAKITGAGITVGENLEHTFYFQFDHLDQENNIDKKHLVELLQCIPEGMPIVVQNGMYERTVLLNELGVDLPNLHDTKMMHSHVDETLPSGLKDMSKRYLNYTQITYEQVVAKGKTMRDYTGAEVFKYGADDPLVTGHLYDLFRIILLLEGTWDFVRENEFTVTYELSNGYLAGVTIDFEESERQRAEDQLTFDNNMARIRELLETHISEEAINRGARNWMEQEIIPNKEAEAKYVLRELKDLIKKPGFADAVKSDKILSGWTEGSIAAGVTFEDLKEVVTEELTSRTRFARGNDKNITEWDKALEAATYKPFNKWRKAATFQFALGKLNQLAEHFGLPVWPAPSSEEGYDQLAVWRAHVDQMDARGKLNTPQGHFCNMVLEVLSLPKEKRSKSEEYKYLRDTYIENFEGGWDQEGTELNIDSPLQMQKFLYAMLGLPIRIRAFEPSKGRELLNQDGAPQTNKDAIAAAIAYGDADGWKKEILELLVEAKACLTRIKFFYNKFPLWKHPIDGQIHPQFNSPGTETRRPSGSAPNLLQLSKKGEGVKVRRCILPNFKLKHDLVGAIDWSAQELRVLAALSGDENMLACYVGDNLRDVHSMTAAYMLDISYDEFMAGYKGSDEKLKKQYDDVRKLAKNVNFGSSYGIGKDKLARQLVLGSKQTFSPDEAGEFLEAKKAAFPGIEEWKAEVKNFLHARGHVRTQFGTIKHVFNKLDTKDHGLIGYYERASINQLIQGVCADYLKKVLTDLWRKQVFNRYGAVLLAPIYDELVFTFHSRNAVDLIMEIYEVMTQGIPGINVPMLAMPSLGVNFGNQIEVLDKETDELTSERILIAVDKAFNPKKKEAA